MKLLAILAIAVLAASHISAQTESVIKTKATDALTESIVIPSGKSVTIASGATITAASGSTVTGFGGTPAWGDITSKPANVTAFGDLANASGVLTNNGSGTLSYTATSAAGSTSDAGKLVKYGTEGKIFAHTAMTINGAGDAAAILDERSIYWNSVNLSAFYGLLYVPNITGNREWILPDVSGTLITTGDTGTVTNTMLAGSIALSKLSITGTPTGSLFLRDDGSWQAASTDLASPGPIGGTTPSTISATTFTSTVSPGETTSAAIILTPATSAASGVQQFSPAIKQTGKLWSTTASTSYALNWNVAVKPNEIGFNLPIGGGLPRVGYLQFKPDIDGSLNNLRSSFEGYNDIKFDAYGTIWTNSYNGRDIVCGGSPETGTGVIFMGTSEGVKISKNIAFGFVNGFDALNGGVDVGLYWSSAGVAKIHNGTDYKTLEDLYRRVGSGSPEGAITAPVGCIYHRTDGGASTSLYVKESGTGNTGWIAK